MFTIIVNLLSVTAYIASAVVILRRFPRYLILFGMVSLMQAWSLISCFYNDLGFYNFELFRYTETTYATSHLALFYLVFNLGFAIAARVLRDRPLARRSYGLKDVAPNLGALKTLVYAGIGLVAAYVFYNMATNGIPALMGIDRNSYLSEASLLDRLLLVWGGTVAFVLGLTSRRRGRFSINGIILALLIVYALMVGHKFSFISQLLWMYATPVFARWVASHPDWKPRLGRYVVRGFVVTAVFLGLAYAVYAKQLANVEGAQSLLFGRVMAFQGEVWWAADNAVAEAGGHDKRHWEDELDKIIDPQHTPLETVGMRYLMIRILGGEKAFPIFDHGYLYTMAYPAILIVTFPYALALLLQCLAGVLLLLLLYYLHWSLVYRHNLRAIVTFLVVLPLAATLSTGNFFVFFTLGILLKVLLLSVAESLPPPRAAENRTPLAPETAMYRQT